MTLFGRLIKDRKCIIEAKTENEDSSLDFAMQLETCLITLCRELDVPVPIWSDKNTKELGCLRKTSFDEGQFVEKIYFDEMRIELKD